MAHNYLLTTHLSFNPGHYADLGKQASGQWLATMLTVAAIVSQIGLTNGATLISDESLQVCLFSKYFAIG